MASSLPFLSYLPVVALCCLAGCVQDHAERVYRQLPPSQTAAAVLYAIPSRSYDLVADIQWVGGDVKKMAARASQLGGDAVIVQILGGDVDFASLSPEQINQRSKTFNRMAGTVIKFK